jgi:hypothetical protein
VELLPPEITWPELPPAIQDRDADVWEALIAVADLADLAGAGARRRGGAGRRGQRRRAELGGPPLG